jgi:hypothetical protein
VVTDPNDAVNGLNEIILIAADGGVWRTSANQAARAVRLPAGVTLTPDTFAQFIQANAAIVLLRGLDTAPLVCYDLDSGFETIAQENEWPVTLDVQTNRIGLVSHNLNIGDPIQLNPVVPNGAALPPGLLAGKTYYVLTTPNADEFTVDAVFNSAATPAMGLTLATVTVLDGAVPIPNAAFGIFTQNRLFLINGKDTVLASDIGDFTRYQPATSVFRANTGDSFTLGALYLYNESTLILFEDGVGRQGTGGTGDLSGAAGPLNVTQAYGIAAPRGIADAGTEVYWLNSELRIVNLQLTALNQTQATDAALSDYLVQTFGRINAAAKDRARLAVHGGLLYCALPLDEAAIVSPINLVPAGQTYTPSTTYTLTGLTAGKTYRWRQGANGGTLLNGTELLRGECDFTAQGTSVQLAAYYGSTSQNYAVTDLIYTVTAQMVNTAVAVYDFKNAAWCGTDENAGITCVVDWLKLHLGGRQRLCFIGADGYLHLYGDQYDYPFEDEVMLPVTTVYLDFIADPIWIVTPNISFIDTLRVNGGTTVQTDLTINQYNTATHWGISVEFFAPGNLWQDDFGSAGFNPATSAPWTAPNTLPTQIPSGVRFTSTNGSLPAIVQTVTGQLFNYYQDPHSGLEIQPVSIPSYLLTRGYPCARLLSQAGYQSMSYTGDATSTRFTNAALGMQTWAATYTINSRTQGAGDVTNYVTNQTRNPVKYTALETPDWVPTNVNEDFNAPGREDYAFQETGAGLYLDQGVNFDQLQEYVDRVPMSEAGLWMQVEVFNTTGHMEMTGVNLEAQSGVVNSGMQVR